MKKLKNINLDIQPMVSEMNKVNLNEYILEGIGEMHSLIAHEVQMLFNNQNRRFDFLRLSNQHFSIIDLKKRDLIIILSS